LSSYAQNTSYPWLDELIDTEDCCFNQRVDVYDYHGVHKFIFVANDENCSSFSEGYTGSLYYQDGRLWCNNRPDLDCRRWYKISYESTIYE